MIIHAEGGHGWNGEGNEAISSTPQACGVHFIIRAEGGAMQDVEAIVQARGLRACFAGSGSSLG